MVKKITTKYGSIYLIGLYQSYPYIHCRNMSRHDDNDKDQSIEGLRENRK